MKKNEMQIGGVYRAKVTDKLVSVRIDAENPHGGWDATNLETNRKVRIKSAQRLRGKATSATQQTGYAPQSQLTLEETKKREAKKKGRKTNAATSSPTSATGAKKSDAATTKAKKAKEATRAKQGDDGAKKVSCIDAAVKVLAESGEPMNCKQMIEAMTTKGYWTSPGGKTPQATLYAAILREIQNKGDDSRFRKVERGKFSAT